MSKNELLAALAAMIEGAPAAAAPAAVTRKTKATAKVAKSPAQPKPIRPVTLSTWTAGDGTVVPKLDLGVGSPIVRSAAFMHRLASLIETDAASLVTLLKSAK